MLRISMLCIFLDMVKKTEKVEKTLLDDQATMHSYHTLII